MLGAFEESMWTPASLDTFGGYCELPHCMLWLSFNRSLVSVKSSRVSTVQFQKNIDFFLQLVEDIDS